MSNKYKLNIVLVEPQIPQNTGNIARTCACTGASLHLIRPLGFEIDDKALKRAGLDYWKFLDIHYYENISEFFDKNNGDYYFFTTKARHNYSDIKYTNNVYIIFGREDKGLDEALLVQHEKNCVRLPMVGNVRSLNLSNTVCVGAYEVLRQWDYPALQISSELINYKW